MATSSLGLLTLDLVAKVGGFINGMDRAERSSDQWRRTVERNTKIAAAAFAAASAAIGGAAVYAVSKSLEQADEMSKTAQRIGIMTEQVAGLQLAFELGGSSSEEMQTSLAKLSDQAMKGNKAFADLGINIKNSSGGYKDAKSLIDDVANAFKDMEDGAKKTGLAMQLFGRSGANIIPVLNSGADGLEEMQETAESLGIVIDTNTARAIEAFNDRLAIMTKQTKGASLQFTAGLTPALTSLSETFFETSDNMKAMRESGEKVGDIMVFIAKAGIGVKFVFETVGNLLAAVAINVKNNFLIVYKVIDTIMTLISNAINLVVGSIQKIVAGGANLLAKILPEEQSKALSEWADEMGKNAYTWDKFKNNGSKAITGLGDDIKMFFGESSLATTYFLDDFHKGLDEVGTAMYNLDKKNEETKKDLEKPVEQNGITNSLDVAKQRSEALKTNLDKVLDTLSRGTDASKWKVELANQGLNENAIANVIKLRQEAINQGYELSDISKEQIKQAIDLGNQQKQANDSYKSLLDTQKKTARQASKLLDIEKKREEQLRKIKETQDNFRELAESLLPPEIQKLHVFQEQLETIEEMRKQFEQGITGGISMDQINQAREALFGRYTFEDMPKFEFRGSDNNPFGGMLEVDKQRAQLESWYEEKKQMLKESLETESGMYDKALQKQLSALEQAMEAQRAILSLNGFDAMLEGAQNVFGELTETAKTYAGENSGIYRAMFAVEKAFAVARAVIAIQQGIAQAAANPWPQNLAAMASVAAATGSIVSTIASVAMPSGMAHEGLDSVPKTGTWLLEKGERVTTAKTSAKLDQTLQQIQNNNTTNNTASPQNIRIINSVDPELMKSYLGSSDGERVIMNVINRNPSALKKVVSA